MVVIVSHCKFYEGRIQFYILTVYSQTVYLHCKKRALYYL